MTGPEPSCWVVWSVERRVADTSMLCAQLFNIMTCKEEARRLKGSGVEVFVAHPGLSTTDHFGKVLCRMRALCTMRLCSIAAFHPLKVVPSRQPHVI